MRHDRDTVHFGEIREMGMRFVDSQFALRADLFLFFFFFFFFLPLQMTISRHPKLRPQVCEKRAP